MTWKWMTVLSALCLAAAALAVTAATGSGGSVAGRDSDKTTLSAEGKQEGTERGKDLGIEFVLIPGGEYYRGSEDGEGDERPVRSVLLGDFHLSKKEITVAQFRAFVEASGYLTDAEKIGKMRQWTGKNWQEVDGGSWRNLKFEQGEDHPVVGVSWNDAVAFCNWAGLRLPTEAEWEYAAGNGFLHTRYSWGDGPPSPDRGGNVADEMFKEKSGLVTAAQGFLEGYRDGFVFTAPVGSYRPNVYGLHDMTGNVNEWCWDYYAFYEKGDEVLDNPRGPETGKRRILRGGAWTLSTSDPRVADRASYFPWMASDFIGFRVARDPS